MIKRIRKIVSILLLLFMIPSFANANTSDTDRSLHRISDDHRISTAVAISKESYTSSDKVVLVGYDGSIDGISGTFYTSKLDAPMLITYKDRLDDRVLDELKRLRAKEVIILGGNMVVDSKVEMSLRLAGFNPKRITGANRIDTAANVAKEHYKGNIDEAFLIGYYDSVLEGLAIAPVAGREAIPTLISRPGELSKETQQLIKDRNIRKITIVGGTDKVGKTIENQLKNEGRTVERINFTNMTDLSLTIQGKYFQDAGSIIVANGHNPVDAFVGGYFASKRNGPILFTPVDNIETAYLDLVGQIKGDIFVLGGNKAVSDDIFNEINEILEYLKEQERPEEPEEPEVPKVPMVCFDYGHGGTSVGAVYQGRKEKDDTLALGMAVASILRSHGIIVDETRVGDASVSLEERVKFANRKNYDYFVSFHRNAFKPEVGTGAETYVYLTDNPKSRSLAEKVQSSMVEVGFADRKVKKGDYYVLRLTYAPAILIEAGFIDNTKDNELFDTKRDQLVQGIADAILMEYGLK